METVSILSRVLSLKCMLTLTLTYIFTILVYFIINIIAFSLQSMVQKSVLCLQLVLLLLITGAIARPHFRARQRLVARSMDYRVGLCAFDQKEHTRCYVCARLYNSAELYTDCCLRTRHSVLIDSCLKL